MHLVRQRKIFHHFQRAHRHSVSKICHRHNNIITAIEAEIAIAVIQPRRTTRDSYHPMTQDTHLTIAVHALTRRLE